MPSNKQFMEIAANALFTYDRDNRMVRVNEPDDEAAPRFFMGRTREGHIWRFRHDLPAEVVEPWFHLESRDVTGR
jgi:hypothetical protein